MGAITWATTWKRAGRSTLTLFCSGFKPLTAGFGRLWKLRDYAVSLPILNETGGLETSHAGNSKLPGGVLTA
jgi:hypothetical protein